MCVNLNTLKGNFQGLSPSLIANYLQYSGWSESSQIRKNISIWHRTEEKNFEFEIIQPLDLSLKDYEQLTLKMFSVLSNFENRSINEISEDLKNFHADVIKIRVVHDDVEGGSIPINDGVLLFQKTKELLSSIVRSTFNKRRCFEGGMSQENQELIQTFRFGQTEIGSYVINIILPLNISSDSQDEFEGMTTASPVREVVNTLGGSLVAIHQSLEKYETTKDITQFEDAIEAGVSANLCDSIIGLTGVKENRDVNISITLANAEESLKDIKLEHSFGSSVTGNLKEASDYYRGKYMIPNFLVSGEVTTLKHEAKEEFGFSTSSRNEIN